MTEQPPERVKICSIDGCGRPSRRRGWCALHYARWYRNGDPLREQKERAPRDPMPGFWAKVDKSGECWIWTGYVMKNGYGTVGFEGKKYLVHRFAYEHMVGPIPDDLVIDHICHNGSGCKGGDDCPHRRCVNPAHLEPVPQVVNVVRGVISEVLRARAAAQTHCKNGHAFSGENLFYREVRGSRQRACRTCSRKAGMQSERRRRAKKREALDRSNQEVCGISQ